MPQVPARFALRLAAGAVLCAPLVALLGLPVPWALAWADPPSTSVMRYRARAARRAGHDLDMRQSWVTSSEIPDHLVRAVLVSEDDRFRDHGGVDWKALGEELRYRGDDSFSWWDRADRSALFEALAYGWHHRSEVKGRSSLTQQLAKNLYFTPERSLLRKAMEVAIAWRLERLLSKERILEIYLNTVELGPGIFGVQAAAEVHFGVSAADLTLYQAASLAATLPHPLTSNPSHRPSRMAWRRDLILQRLRGGEVTIPDEPPPVELPPELNPVAPTLPDTGAVSLGNP